jgi:voltage-gated potassium channel
MKEPFDNKPGSGWRRKLYTVIFDADTFAGKFFDVLLIIAISLSVLVVMMDSMATFRAEHGKLLRFAEWFFTILFSIEYLIRVICVRSPRRYIFSFYGIIDILAVLPTYLSLVLPGTQYLLTIRVLRILRIFRVLKLVKYLDEANYLTKALAASRRKISVFLFAVIMIAIFAGSLIYVVEGQENGFTSIPTSIYWAIVTLSTVGFGDIAPVTALGKFIAALIMVLGYGIIAVPTGIVSYEMARLNKDQIICPNCEFPDHDQDAVHCKKCGAKLT